MPISEAVERFLRMLAERGYSPRTIEGYRADLGVFCRFVAGRLGSSAPFLAEVNVELVRDFVAATGSSGRVPSPAFRNRRLSAIRSLFSFAREAGLWTGKDAPDRQVRFSRLPRTEPSFLHYDEYLAILDAIRRGRSSIRRARDFAIVVACFNCGVRLNEVVSLDCWQFNPTARVFSAVRRKGNLVQDVLMNRNVVNAVADWLRLRSEGEGPLFLGRGGRRISPRAVQRMVVGYAKAAGITKPVTVHTLRHAFCYEVQKRGAGIEVARRLMAHRSLTTTLRYTHARDDELRIAIDAFDDPRTWSAEATVGNVRLGRGKPASPAGERSKK